MGVQTHEERRTVASGDGKEGLGAMLSQMSGWGDPAWPGGGPSLAAAPGSTEILPD